MNKIILITLCILNFGCATPHKLNTRNPSEDQKTNFDHYVDVFETKYFKIRQVKSDPPVPANDLDILKKKLDTAYVAIEALIGPPDWDFKKFDVLLEGAGMRQDGSALFPSVDDFGVIRLYQFPGLGGSGYLQGLPHEIVHAFRTKLRHLHNIELGDYLKGFGFIEEAFAEYISEIVEPTSISFVNYGFPRQVVTGYWLTTHNEIPLTVLFNHHNINGKCVAQAYPLRTSFFFYLEQKFGRASVIKLAKSEKSTTAEIFNTLFSKDLSTLESDWKIWALAEFNHFDNHDAVLQMWLTRTPIKYFPVCKPPFF